MDRETLAAYDNAAPAFVEDWRSQPPSPQFYALLRRLFRPGGQTADIGCGSGDHVEWLNANGFPAIGYDASSGMLAQAGALHPQRQFAHAALPALDGIADGAFDNVLCVTVIMHLDRDELASSVRRLMSILKPEGILYVSWRTTDGADQRDGRGRLYTAFDRALLEPALASATILLDEASVSEGSGKRIHHVVARKGQ